MKKTAIKTFSSLLLSASALTSVGFISPALAQTTTATPSEEATDVVIVTARRRDEALQDVPISVTSLSAAAISPERDSASCARFQLNPHRFYPWCWSTRPIVGL
jgi:iron complex outermembrane receptor protein